MSDRPKITAKTNHPIAHLRFDVCLTDSTPTFGIYPLGVTSGPPLFAGLIGPDMGKALRELADACDQLSMDRGE